MIFSWVEMKTVGAGDGIEWSEVPWIMVQLVLKLSLTLYIFIYVFYL